MISTYSNVIIDIILLYVDQLLIIKINENDNIKFSKVDT